MIRMIAAMSFNRVIGLNNKLPWHYKEDLRWFKKVTYGKTIVMGRFTYESIGHPLPGRNNIVLTSKSISGVKTVSSIDEILKLGDVFIIGGSSLYLQFMPYAKELYLTLILKEFTGDRFFPEFFPKKVSVLHRVGDCLFLKVILV